MNTEDLISLLPQGLSLKAGDSPAGAQSILTERGALVATYSPKDKLLCADAELYLSERDDIPMGVEELLDVLHSGFIEGFLPQWEFAGFTLDSIDESSASADHVIVLAHLEAPCESPDEFQALLAFVHAEAGTPRDLLFVD
jgi:hypothetical protein